MFTNTPMLGAYRNESMDAQSAYRAQQYLMNSALPYTNSLANMAGLGYSLLSAGLQPCTASSEGERRPIESRWSSRMLRIVAKRWVRRKLVLAEWAYRIGLVWGGMVVVGITIALAGLLARLVLG